MDGDDAVTNGATNVIYNSSWVLTKIISPNGMDQYDFNYSTPGYWDTDVVQSNASRVIIDLIDNCTNTTYPEINPQYPSGGYYIEHQFPTQVLYNGNLIFSLTKGIRHDVHTAAVNGRLDQLLVYNTKGERLNKIVFNNDDYFNLDGGDKTTKSPFDIRLKLNSIDIYSSSDVDFQSYSFVYNTPDFVPSRLSKSQDLIGLYNGKSNNVLYPKAILGSCVFQGANRDPVSSSADNGILTKITYPTRGFTQYYYEGNRDDNNNLEPGLRIYKIEDYKETGDLFSKRTYSYVNEQGLKSGRTNSLPSLVSTVTFNGRDNNSYQRLIRNSGIPKGELPNIYYKSVKEIIYNENGESNGYTFYKFYPASSGMQSWIVSPYENYINSDVESGKPLSNDRYSEDNSMVSEDTYSYFKNYQGVYTEGLVLYLNENYNNNEIFIKDNGTYFSIERHPIYCDNPTVRCALPNYVTNWQNYYAGHMDRKYGPLFSRSVKATGSIGNIGAITKTEFFTNGLQSQSTKEFSYDSSVDYLLRKIKNTYDNQNIEEEFYYYPKDNMVGASQELVNNNCLSKIVKTEKFYNPVTYSSNELVFKKQYDFKELFAGGPILPYKISLSKSGNFEERIFLEYYNNGRLRESYQNNGPSSLFFWDDDYIYPIASIKNATSSEVAAQLGITVNQLENLDENDLNSINGLRTNLSKSYINTYEQKSRVGLLSLTNPRGQTTSYQYDNHNRLSKIVDEMSYIISEFIYNLKD
ncbi:YD repeat-containing protein [Gillisia sp. Hel_I_86]|uniref:RHS repeat domain-containing protein n=1 Tax=Gillisia sp. Hel_I_86 TaxID=1249981 RepID=UPI0011992B81|nr:RHS repeat domain-containing protein [Gillisia sp. Hel_I_86]TVZ27855.1 YD repeat-containing protein [Gillisia sp. Hel_I_86]